MAHWGQYISVGERRAKAKREMNKLRKKGVNIQPVEIEGRKIARSYWGAGWCSHLESFSDYSNRLPRGRTYARNGSVCHLDIQSGRVEAIVSGSSLYNVEVTVDTLDEAVWESVKEKCVGHVGSILELLQGKLSDEVMSIVGDRNIGIFPTPKEIHLHCDCPDWATMCKHVAAVLYGVGNRLDHQPELLFLLRGVNPEELVAAQFTMPQENSETSFDEGQLSDIFGIDLDEDFEVISTHVEESPTFDSGESVKALRKDLNMTIAQFSRELGVSMATINRWEKCKRLSMKDRNKEALQALKKRGSVKQNPG